MQHCIYMRLKYSDHAEFLTKFAMLRDTAFPSLTWQKVPLDIQMLVKHAEHGRMIDDLFGRPVSVFAYEFGGYDVQSRLDCDDIIYPDFYKRVESFYEVGVPKVVTSQIKKFAWHTGETYIYSSTYHAMRCSMFTTIMNPPEGVNIMSYKHGDLWQVSPDNVVVLDEDMCRLVVHGHNTLTGIGSRDVKVEREKPKDIVSGAF